MRSTPLCLVLLAHLLFVSGLHAEKKWLRLTSPHFEMFTTEGEKTARRGLVHFETVYGFFAQVLGPPANAVPVTIVAFGTLKEFRDFRGKDFAQAFYLPDRDRDYIVMGGLGESEKHSAVHEYVHLLMRRSGAEVPLWLNEGLAEVYATLRPAGKKVRIGDTIPSHARQLSMGGWTPLDVLLTVDHGSNHYEQQELVGAFYAQSWFLVHMLTLSEDYRAKFGEFTSQLLSGRSSVQSLQAVYGKSVQELDGDLRSYRQQPLRVAVVDVKLQKAAVTPALELADLAQVGLVKARILAVSGRVIEADQIYSGLLNSGAESCGLHEAVGYRYWQTEDTVSAVRHFQKAAELGSTNGKLYLDYAGLLHQSGASDDEVIPILRQAVVLMPDNVDARFNLGSILLARREYRDALNQLGSIRQVAPERAFSYFHGLSIAYHGTGNQEDAQKAAERAREHARTAAEISGAEQLLSFLDASSGAPMAPTAVTRPESARPRTDGGERPRIHRPDSETRPPDKPPPKATRQVTGVVVALDCLGNAARLRLHVEGAALNLAIRNPTEVVVTSADNGVAQLNCGPQTNLSATVEYVPAVDEELDTIGAVKRIHFQGP